MYGLHHCIISPASPERQASKTSFGGLAEWSKAAVLKTVEERSSRGSNPWPTAINENAPFMGAFSFMVLRQDWVRFPRFDFHRAVPHRASMHR